MDPTVLVALIGLAGVAMGWFAKVTVAAISRSAPKEWNGQERRAVQDLVDAKVTLHAFQCPAKRDFNAALDKTRLELKGDMEKIENRLSVDLAKFREELRESLHNLHEEIQRRV